jgi:hypothetical protein
VGKRSPLKKVSGTLKGQRHPGILDIADRLDIKDIAHIIDIADIAEFGRGTSG